MNRFFLPINATSLAHYFGGACILPSCYYNNKPEDLQDRFKGLLLLTIHNGTRQTNCCLELYLDDYEQKNLIAVDNGFFLYEKPLPISRVIHIYFSKKEQLDTTITNIRMGTAFIPDRLISIEPAFESIDASTVLIPKDLVINDMSGKQKDYDRILGGLSVMNVAHPDYMNYSENYFSTLSFFNDFILHELLKANVQINKSFQTILVGNKNDRLNHYLYESISDELVERIAAEEHQIIQKDRVTKVVNLDTLDKSRCTYIFAVLNTYGTDAESKKKKVDELFLSRFSGGGIKPGKSEGIALCYGISRGYSVFRNKYELNGNCVNVKYKLETLLDYYTIESVYQYVYNGKKSGQLLGLSWVPPKKTDLPKRETDYIVIDENVIGKKKPRVTSSEYVKALFSRFFQDAAFEFFEKFITEITRIVYADTKKEIEEDNFDNIQHYKDELKSIKAQHAQEVAEIEKKRQADIDALKRQLTDVKQKFSCVLSDKHDLKYGDHDAKGPDAVLSVLKNNMPEIKKIIKEAVNLGKENKAELKRIAQCRMITLDNGDKTDMVIKIMTGSEDLKLFNH